MLVRILEQHNATGLDIAQPLVGAHHKVVHIEDVLLVLAKELLTALGAIHHQHNVVVLAEPGHWLQRQDPDWLELLSTLSSDWSIVTCQSDLPPGHRRGQRTPAWQKHPPEPQQ